MKRIICLLGLLTALISSSRLWAQQAGYSQTNLVSNTAGVATITDPQLLNPWGISVLPGQEFWLADNNSGVSTLYDQNGAKDSGLIVTIPGATSNPNGNCSPGCPTGTVANASGSYFSGGSFIFDTEDGLIAYWNGSSNTAIVGKDNSASGAVYKSLAILGTNLLAANFNSGKVDVFDSNYNLISLGGSFTDAKLPAGFAPHGVHIIGSQVYVAYAMQDAAKHDAVPGAGAGQVDIFDTNGNFVSTLIAAGANNNLNAPWGVVTAPSSFGAFAGDILVGNFGDGTISAFDTTGKFIGQLSNSAGTLLVNPGLWDMVFGGGGGANNDPGATGTLYITAGGSAGQPNFPAGGSATAVFASLVPAAAVGSPNFSLNLSAKSTTVAAGSSANLMVSAAAVGGFNGQISLTCSAPAGLTCAFSPSTISPGSSAASSTLTIAAAATPPAGGGGYSVPGMAATLLPGLGLFGTVFATRKRKPRTRKRVMWMGLMGLLLLSSLFALGCGGSSHSTTPTPSSQQVTVMVTGTSGSLSQSAAVTVTIN
ncbi:MAG TPA: TIGR03118 family protein [Candidatus Sulfotelmatobacter sp.]